MQVAEWQIVVRRERAVLQTYLWQANRDESVCIAAFLADIDREWEALQERLQQMTPDSKDANGEAVQINFPEACSSRGDSDLGDHAAPCPECGATGQHYRVCSQGED